MLEIKQVTLHYGASQALRGVDLTAEKGRVTALLGRNGVGKTSLLRAIVGQQPISGGQIVWESQDLAGKPTFRRARSGIAYVPQGREIFPQLTVEENLRSGLGWQAQGTIPEHLYELFPVLKSMLHRKGGDLSGGQQQQLAIARALTLQPRLLVLDEPTEGIQPSIIKDIAAVIRKLRDTGSMAILLVEQYFEFAHELADDLAVMDRGQVVLSGKREALQEAEVRRFLTV